MSSCVVTYGWNTCNSAPEHQMCNGRVRTGWLLRTKTTCWWRGVLECVHSCHGPTVHTRLEKHGKAPVPGPATEQPLQCPLCTSMAINFCEVQDPGSGGLHQHAAVLSTPYWFGYCIGQKWSQAVVNQLSLSFICFGLFSQLEVLLVLIFECGSIYLFLTSHCPWVSTSQTWAYITIVWRIY